MDYYELPEPIPLEAGKWYVMGFDPGTNTGFVREPREDDPPELKRFIAESDGTATRVVDGGEFKRGVS